jgi:CheY-like chemotaxis protein
MTRRRLGGPGMPIALAGVGPAPVPVRPQVRAQRTRKEDRLKVIENPCSRPTVLYVDDHSASALLVATLLESRPDLLLVHAHTGSQALGMATQLRLQLLLLDLQLPDRHASQLLKQLRQLPGCAHVPAVALSSDLDFDITDSGFAELWPKPWDMTQVLNRLQVWTPTASSHAAHRGRYLNGNARPAAAPLTRSAFLDGRHDPPHSHFPPRPGRT